MTTPLRGITTPDSPAWQSSVDTLTAAPAESDPAASADITTESSRTPPPPRSVRNRLAAVLSDGQQWLRHKGFFFTSLQDGGSALPLTSRGVLVADVLNDSDASRTVAGIALPRFVTEPKNWVVLTGRTERGIADGLGALVANSHWKDLNGEAVVFDPDSGQVQSMQPRTLTYVVPQSVALGDLRPILGGIMSSNIALSGMVLLVLLVLLGVFTHLMLRFVGERQP